MRKTVRKLIAVLVCMAMVTAVVPAMSVFAESVSGTCGDNLTWTFDADTGVLTISGTGDMEDYSSSMSPWAMYGENMKSVITEDGVTSIGGGAFYGYQNLESVTISDGVASIGDSAFYDCKSLININIPDSVTHIGSYAFVNTAYYKNESNWEDDVLYIGKHLITAAMTIDGDYIVKDGTLTIADNAFVGCSSLTSVDIPVGVTGIGFNVFASCTSLKNVIIPDSVTYIGFSAFDNCTSLTSVIIPDGVTEIGVFAFWGCTSLESIVIPNSVTTIYAFAFSNCTSLTSIIIPDSVESIGENAFYGCENLTDVTIQGGDTIIANGAFEGTNATIYGYSGSVAERYAASAGNAFVSIGSIVMEADEVRVTNTDELLAALRSYRTIILADGVYITDSSLDICAVDLTLKAENSGKAEILSRKDNQPVVYITYSQNITFDGIIFGHESLPPAYSCDTNDHKGHVIHANVSDNVYVANCDLYGCGVIGVCCERVNGFKAENCVIRDCRDQIVSFSEGSYGEFVNCVMSGNAYDDEVSYYLHAAELDGGDISFDNCIFINNHSEIFSASENLTTAADEGDSITLNGCTFKNNAWDGEVTLNCGVCLNGITWKVENDTLYIGYPLEFGDGTTIASKAGEVLPYSASSLPWKKLSYSNTVLADGVTYSSDASDKITVELNGTAIQFDQPPIIINGRTMVPLRAIFEALGASVDWDGETMTVTAVKGAVSIKMTIGEDAMYVNGNAVTLDVAPQLVNSRTLVPARAIAEAFDCNVEWNNDTRTVIITN